MLPVFFIVFFTLFVLVFRSDLYLSKHIYISFSTRNFQVVYVFFFFVLIFLFTNLSVYVDLLTFFWICREYWICSSFSHLSNRFCAVFFGFVFSV